jgi:hypothetical protein
METENVDKEELLQLAYKSLCEYCQRSYPCAVCRYKSIKEYVKKN